LGEGVNDSNSVIKIQKKGLRLVEGVKNRVSYRSLFGDFKILTVTSLYVGWNFNSGKTAVETPCNVTK
jgi:hypothetical protein